MSKAAESEAPSKTTEQDQIVADLADLSAVETNLNNALAGIRGRKAALKRARIRAGAEIRPVTDHAIIRYLERHKGFDIETVRDEMRAIAAAADPAKDGEHHIHQASGVIMVLGADGTIVTVLSAEQSEKWIGRRLANGGLVGGD
jgi:hypothetical protein